ncbi:flagellar assembly protein FliH [Marinomonas agarivorans]|nr:flagellar assembly protein FliH [Marinomonas agarivorans]
MSEDTSNNSENKLTAYERWELPHLKNPTPRKDSGPSILLRKDATIVHEEVDESALVYEPLTALQLEEISAAAYDEGYVQGLDEGYQAGLEKGYEEGLAKGIAEGTEKGTVEGLEKGTEQGIQEAHEKLLVVEEMLEKLRLELESPLLACKDQVEKIIYQTVSRLVENITYTQLNESAADTLSSQINYLFRQLEELEHPVRITVHPDMADLIATFTVFDRVGIKIEKDESIAVGGFLLDTKGAYLDASIEHRISTILADLQSIHPQSESDSNDV